MFHISYTTAIEITLLSAEEEDFDTYVMSFEITDVNGAPMTCATKTIMMALDNIVDGAETFMMTITGVTCGNPGNLIDCGIGDMYPSTTVTINNIDTPAAGGKDVKRDQIKCCLVSMSKFDIYLITPISKVTMNRPTRR